MKKVLLPLLFLLVSSMLSAQENTECPEVMLETSMGNVRVMLYNDTPLHRDNFLKNVNEGLYDGVLFHRVISSFMIQAGDTATRSAQPGERLGESEERITIPAEIRFPQRWHKRGALCAAREGDEVNPERASSQFQFYIVYGRRYTDEQLNSYQERLDKATGGQVVLTPELREAYYKIGGTPHLDGQYTVFGEVLEGLDVVKEIQWVPTDDHDRPVNDVRILKAYQIIK